MADKRLVITIGRQYGSGGAETGRRLAEELGIGFYDKNILRVNSDESGIKESYFHLADEKAGSRKRARRPSARISFPRTTSSASSPK